MSAPKALSIVLVATLAFAAIGTVIGVGLGTLCPDYYRTVFRGGDSPNFNPIQVGIGLGITQGVAAGAVIGIVILGVLVWAEARKASSK